MRNRQFFQDGALFGSPDAKTSALPLATTNDAGLLALEAQFDSLVAELVAAQKASDAAIYPGRGPSAQDSVEAGSEPDTDQGAQTKKAEAVLARLYPIEQAIMATPARTITGLGVKARHAAYVMSQYWEAPVDQIDWDARAMRLLIEAVCGLANVPLPSCETTMGDSANEHLGG
jgi:hypothetical protein